MFCKDKTHCTKTIAILPLRTGMRNQSTVLLLFLSIPQTPVLAGLFPILKTTFLFSRKGYLCAPKAVLFLWLQSGGLPGLVSLLRQTTGRAAEPGNKI